MKLRISFSLLNAWSQGRIDEALQAYFHIPHETPANYVEGKRWDEYAQEYIQKHSSLPPEWGEDKLTDPIIQKRIRVPYNASWELICVLDVLEPYVITELKSGKSSAGDYARTAQVPMYILGAQLSDIPITHARIIRYNQNTGLHDRAILQNTDRIIDKARNYIDSIAPEIEDYFTAHDLFKPEEEVRLRLTNAK